MLKRDELLPEEQAHLGLIQELQTIYQMEPQEKQVLAHVHDRLSRQVATSSRTIKASRPARTLRLVTPTSSTARPVKAPRRWQRVGGLAAVLFVALLIISLTLTFTSMRRLTSVANGGNTINQILVPAEKGVTLSPTELAMSRTLLLRRFNSFGLSDVSVQATTAANGKPAIQLQWTHFDSNEQAAINTLLTSGVMEFWDTGDAEAKTAAIFDPSQYTQYNPGNRPGFTGMDIDANSLKSASDKITGQFTIQFSMRGDAIQRFQSYTAARIGDHLTITLDRKVLESAVINSAISGPGEIAGDFTQQSANVLVADLKSGALPVALQLERD
jgi:preprotein translocase subunit SecD